MSHLNKARTFELQLAAAAEAVFFQGSSEDLKGVWQQLFLKLSQLNRNCSPSTERKDAPPLVATDDDFPELILERSSCRARLISIPLLRVVIRLCAALQLG